VIGNVLAVEKPHSSPAFAKISHRKKGALQENLWVKSSLLAKNLPEK
jgi:hypothetical protein